MYAVKNGRRSVALARDYHLTDGGNLRIERLDGQPVLYADGEWAEVADLPLEEIETMVVAGCVTERSEQLYREHVEDAEVMEREA